MTEAIQNLIEALRTELKQYGEMLALLDQQQEWVVRRATDELLQSVTDVQTQCAVIHSARRHREDCQNAVANAAGLPDGTTFAEMLPHLPSDYRPLLGALIDENNALLLRIQQRSRQNHVLLSRSLEMMQRLISTLCPGGSPVYSERGSLTGGALPVHSLYEAVG